MIGELTLQSIRDKVIATSTEKLPLVTIIMPVRNEAAFIRQSLDGVLSQDYPPDRMEILVVDGQSNDGTRIILDELAAERASAIEAGQKSAALRVLDNPLRIVPAALNIGLQHARGDIVFRLDGHSDMALDYVRKCATKLVERSDVACVGGPSIAEGDGLIGGAYALALRSPFGAGGRTFRTLRTESYVDTVAFGCYRREIFDEVGNFDQDLQRNQDIEFSARLRKAGHQLLLIGDTNTVYHAPKTLRGIIKQGFNNGYWNTKVLNKMLGVLSWRHFVPCAFVLGLLVCTLLALLMPWGWYLLALACASYTLGALSAGVLLLWQTKNARALLGPPIFAIMHVSYGVGSIVGLIKYFFQRTLGGNWSSV